HLVVDPALEALRWQGLSWRRRRPCRNQRIDVFREHFNLMGSVALILQTSPGSVDATALPMEARPTNANLPGRGIPKGGVFDFGIAGLASSVVPCANFHTPGFYSRLDHRTGSDRKGMCACTRARAAPKLIHAVVLGFSPVPAMVHSWRWDRTVPALSASGGPLFHPRRLRSCTTCVLTGFPVTTASMYSAHRAKAQRFSSKYSALL